MRSHSTSTLPFPVMAKRSDGPTKKKVSFNEELSVADEPHCDVPDTEVGVGSHIGTEGPEEATTAPSLPSVANRKSSLDWQRKPGRVSVATKAAFGPMRLVSQAAPKKIKPLLRLSSHQAKARHQAQMYQHAIHHQRSVATQQQAARVDKRQLQRLHKGLTDRKQAGKIIAELRTINCQEAHGVHAQNNVAAEGSLREALRIDRGSACAQSEKTASFTAASKASRMKFIWRTKQRLPQHTVVPTTSHAKTLVPPEKGACLDCTETEAIKRHEDASVDTGDPPSTSLSSPTVAASPGAQPRPSLNLSAQSRSLVGVAPVNLLALASPSSSAPRTIDANDVILAVGQVSGDIIQASGTDSALKPPTDRMAVYTFWWGYEITIPEQSMQYLQTAQSISDAFMTFLYTLATMGGMPELLPYIKGLGTFVDLEFSSIRKSDHGQGVVLAATWLMPMAIIPRAWDYPLTGTVEKNTVPVNSSTFVPLTSPSRDDGAEQEGDGVWIPLCQSPQSSPTLTPSNQVARRSSSRSSSRSASSSPVARELSIEALQRGAAGFTIPS